LENLQEVLDTHKLSMDDYEHIVKIMGREPNLVEVGIFSAMWSEHCSYKSSRKYLSGFPTKAPWVIQGPGENAGVIDVGDGIAAVFKMESHNHPSFIEPFQGAATGVGGILRDIFTMGARPVANMNALRFGDVQDKGDMGKLHRHLVRGVVDGISFYGNCIGVPMVAGETSFDSSYNGNILVNAFNLGLAPSDKIFYGRSEGIGNPVIYVGSKTGRDGLGGAVMSSDSFDDESESKRPTVQVGDPFTEKLLMEACMDLFQTDHIVGIQDMGAAGLTSSAYEMADRSGSGMIMHLDKVPAREEGMVPYEFMLSESQERMLICAKAGHEEQVLEIFRKYELEAEVIGEVTDTGRMELMWHGEVAADMPISPVVDEAPILDRPTSRPKYLDEIANVTMADFATPDASEALLSMISHPEIADKKWIYEQYDSTIQTNSVTRIGMSDAGVIRVKESNKAIAMSCDCNPRYCYIDPKVGAAQAVVESGRNVAMSGARPKAITDCLNFGNPENPEVMWQFAQACEGIKEACAELTTPVVSGNVSLYNETNGTSVFPTPAIAMVGIHDDNQNILTAEFKEAGNSVYLLGHTGHDFGGSLYMKIFGDTVAGKMGELNYDTELKLWDLIINANEKRLLKTAHDVSVGGIAVALAKMSILSNLGFAGNVSIDDEESLFSESQSRAIVELSSKNAKLFEKMANDLGVEFEKIGEVTGKDMTVNSISLSSETLNKSYFNSFETMMKQDI
jgi:phosphoribosylformylglycinamidine synthase